MSSLTIHVRERCVPVYAVSADEPSNVTCEKMSDVYSASKDTVTHFCFCGRSELWICGCKSHPTHGDCKAEYECCTLSLHCSHFLLLLSVIYYFVCLWILNCILAKLCCIQCFISQRKITCKRATFGLFPFSVSCAQKWNSSGSSDHVYLKFLSQIRQCVCVIFHRDDWNESWHLQYCHPAHFQFKMWVF